MVTAAFLVFATIPVHYRLPSLDFLPSRPIVQHWLDYQRDPTHDWSGIVQLYCWRGDWIATKSAALREIRSKFDHVDVWPKDTASLFFFGGADLRVCWDLCGDSVGLYRDFKVAPQRITDLYSQSWRLKGTKAKGWVSAVVFHDRSDAKD